MLRATSGELWYSASSPTQTMPSAGVRRDRAPLPERGTVGPTSYANPSLTYGSGYRRSVPHRHAERTHPSARQRNHLGERAQLGFQRLRCYSWQPADAGAEASCRQPGLRGADRPVRGGRAFLSGRASWEDPPKWLYVQAACLPWSHRVSSELSAIRLVESCRIRSSDPRVPLRRSGTPEDRGIGETKALCTGTPHCAIVA